MPNILGCERCFAFHQTVSAHKLLPIDPQLFLDTLSNQLNISMVVNGIKVDWLNHYPRNWYNMVWSFCRSIILQVPLWTPPPTLKTHSLCKTYNPKPCCVQHPQCCAYWSREPWGWTLRLKLKNELWIWPWLRWRKISLPLSVPTFHQAPCRIGTYETIASRELSSLKFFALLLLLKVKFVPSAALSLPCATGQS